MAEPNAHWAGGRGRWRSPRSPVGRCCGRCRRLRLPQPRRDGGRPGRASPSPWPVAGGPSPSRCPRRAIGIAVGRWSALVIVVAPSSSQPARPTCRSSRSWWLWRCSRPPWGWPGWRWRMSSTTDPAEPADGRPAAAPGAPVQSLVRWRQGGEVRPGRAGRGARRRGGHARPRARPRAASPGCRRPRRRLPRAWPGVTDRRPWSRRSPSSTTCRSSSSPPAPGTTSPSTWASTARTHVASLYAFRDAVERRIDYATGRRPALRQQRVARDLRHDRAAGGLPRRQGGDHQGAAAGDAGTHRGAVRPAVHRADGTEVDGAFLIMVSNNPYVLGATLDASQRRRLDTGTLGVVAVTGTTGRDAAAVDGAVGPRPAPPQPGLARVHHRALRGRGPVPARPTPASTARRSNSTHRSSSGSTRSGCASW